MVRSVTPRHGHRVLHIGGRRADAEAMRDRLTASTGEPLELEWVEALSHGLERLATTRVSALLLDLRRADDTALEDLSTLRLAAAGIPILVVGADTADGTATRLRQAGADDYVLTTRLDDYWWPRLVRHAIDENPSADTVAATGEGLEGTLDSIGDAMVSTDPAGLVTYLNRAAEKMTGWSRTEATGRPLGDVLHLVDAATREVTDPLEGVFSAAYVPHFIQHCVLVQPDGSEFAVEHRARPIHGVPEPAAGAVIVLRDVSAAHAMAVRMSYLASHDPLTDLPNRLLLGDRLARALALASRHGRRLAVLCLDIDRFKHINDSLGHLVGDELLRSVARDLTLCVRSSDTVGRIGGDEFVVVLSELEHVEDAAIGARKILEGVGQPRHLSGHDVRVTMSVGISVYPDDGEDAQGLLTCADLALYHAKDQGRNCYQFFEHGVHAQALERRSVEAGLQRAIDRHEFELHYQPKVNLRTGDIAGAEALIRWRHPDRGLVEPDAFVPLAEDCGLIAPIGRWVVHEACRQAKAWQLRGYRPIPVSVNVSAVELRSREFLTGIRDVLRETRLDPRHLEVEITEGTLMADGDGIHSVLHALRALGVRVTIDDFGTGWSSLSYLQRLPIDGLKVDKSFLAQVTTSVQVAPIISAVIAMGRSLKHRVTAEGVETGAQLAFLRAEDCDEGQGYFLGRPLAASRFERTLNAGARLAHAGSPTRRMQAAT